MEGVEDGDASFHDEGDVTEEGDVREGITLHGDEVGEFPGLDGADGVLLVEEFGGSSGGGADGFERSEAALGESDEFLGILALQVGAAGIETAGDFDADGFGQPYFLVSSLQKVIVSFARLAGELRGATFVRTVHNTDGRYEKDAFRFH